MAAVADPNRVLMHPFETGDVELPGAGKRAILLGAEPGLMVPDDFLADLRCVQGFRPSYLRLQREGRTVTPAPTGENFDLAMVLAQKHRGLNEARIEDAVRRSAPGAAILVAGLKDDGIASLRKRVAALTPLDGSVAKHHGVAFWFRRPAAGMTGFQLGGADHLPPVAGRFVAAPGMFSHDRIDPGSALLAQHLPGDLGGAAADFGAGWGYLASELLARCPRIASVDLYEADHASLEAARLNLAGVERPVAFHWADLMTEGPAQRFDVVVMNPPFHRGRAGDPTIGMAMIRAAAAALRPNGRLLVVANAHLPYEEVLATGFRRVEEVVRANGFKVLAARR